MAANVSHMTLFAGLASLCHDSPTSMRPPKEEVVKYVTDASTGKQYVIIKHEDICTFNLAASKHKCRSRPYGAFVPQPRNRRENDFLASLSNGPIFLGLTDVRSEGHWTWERDGSFVTWKNWIRWPSRYPTEPNGHSAENCAVMSRNAYCHLNMAYDPTGWEDVACNVTLAVKETVCERGPSKPPNGKILTFVDDFFKDKTCDEQIFDPCENDNRECGGNQSGIISPNPMIVGEDVTIRCNSSLLDPVHPVTSIVVGLNDMKLTDVRYSWDVPHATFCQCRRYWEKEPHQECWTGGNAAVKPREYIEVVLRFTANQSDLGKYSCTFNFINDSSTHSKYFYEYTSNARTDSGDGGGDGDVTATGAGAGGGGNVSTTPDKEDINSKPVPVWIVAVSVVVTAFVICAIIGLCWIYKCCCGSRREPDTQPKSEANPEPESIPMSEILPSPSVGLSNELSLGISTHTETLDMPGSGQHSFHTDSGWTGWTSQSR